MYSHPVALGDLDAHANVFVSGEKNSVSDRVIPSKVNQISYDQ